MLVIGLDGATFDLIKPWAEQGYLPTLARLLEEGAHGSLHSTLPPMTAPAWTTFATGVNPGKHRLYDWIAREPDSYRFPPVTSLDCKAPTIYSLLGDAGRAGLRAERAHDLSAAARQRRHGLGHARADGQQLDHLSGDALR